MGDTNMNNNYTNSIWVYCSGEIYRAYWLEDELEDELNEDEKREMEELWEFIESE